MVRVRTSNTKVETIVKEGECKLLITLDLNININPNGGISVEGAAEEVEKEEDKVKWAIPDFDTKEKIKFGKDGG